MAACLQNFRFSWPSFARSLVSGERGGGKDEFDVIGEINGDYLAIYGDIIRLKNYSILICILIAELPLEC